MSPATEPQEAPPPPVTTRRTFKKLSEPQHSDIISAVLVSAGKKTGVQRAQSFSPRSATDTPSAPPPGPLRAFSVHAAGEARPLEAKKEEALNGAGQGASVSTDDAGFVSSDVKRVNRYTVQWSDSEDKRVDRSGGVSPSSSDPSTSEASSARDSPRQATTTSRTAEDRDFVPVKTASPADRASPSLERKFSQPPKQGPQVAKSRLSESPRSVVSQLRAQFNKLEESADRAGGAGGGGIRRWHSMPLKQERPTVVKVREATLV